MSTDSDVRSTLEFALRHVTELEDAWSRGAIEERDGKGGTRSNRNAAVRVKLEAALILPWPPSMNHYWRKNGHAMYISQQGKAYRENVAAAVAEAGCPRVNGRLAVEFIANPPNRQRRDIDNLLKVPMDALTKARVWEDDEQIDQLSIRRGAVVADGELLVHVRELV